MLSTEGQIHHCNNTQGLILTDRTGKEFRVPVFYITFFDGLSFPKGILSLRPKWPQKKKKKLLQLHKIITVWSTFCTIKKAKS